VTVYTDGSCTKNGSAIAKAGSGIWYGPNNPRNTSIRLPDNLASNNAGELVAILQAIQDNSDAREIRIVSD
ncbi:hypothetical protein DFP72DRAFT_747663, partial [Ephemerocybe angulata]